MPNHHIVDGGDAEKGGHDAQYAYDSKGGAYEEPFVHGHATIAEAAGTGGATHRGLKSRHIQFLYVHFSYFPSQLYANVIPGLSVVLSELVCLWAQVLFLPW
jgi:hypothetical protein